MNTSQPSGPDGAATAFAELAEELAASFRAWKGVPPGGAEPRGRGEAGRPAGGSPEERRGVWPERGFGELALRAFNVQFAGNGLYRRYCRARGAVPGSVESWEDVPPVPTAVFREVGLLTGEPRGEGEVLEFRTSGTTRGAARRGRHLVPDPGLYRASLLSAFRRFVLRAEGMPPLDDARFCFLVPPFRESGGSSLSWMAGAVMEGFGRPGSAWAAGRNRLDPVRADRAARRAEGDGEPLCVFTTTLALDEWTRRLEAAGAAVRLPPGSRIMDTGGTKGRGDLRRGDVLERAAGTLGVGRDRVVNEFGMTELLSQRYSAPGADGAGGRAGGQAGPWLHGPPWLRTRALDPVTLEAVPDGEEGILCHFDLANLGSVCAVLTEDRGRVRDDGAVQWKGRTPGSPPRGCSLATAELLEGRT